MFEVSTLELILQIGLKSGILGYLSYATFCLGFCIYNQIVFQLLVSVSFYLLIEDNDLVPLTILHFLNIVIPSRFLQSQKIYYCWMYSDILKSFPIAANGCLSIIPMVWRVGLFK